MNSVILIGNLTKDPEVRYTTGQDPTAVCTFNIALNRGRDRNGNDRGADFPRVTVFGRMAENCEKYLAKGRKVAIQGHIQTGSYEKDGRTIYTTDVVADRVEFLGGNQQQNQGSSRPSTTYETYSGSQYSEPQEAPAGFEALDDDIPF